MFCKKCGESIPDNAKFCPNCGTRCNDEGETTEISFMTILEKLFGKRGAKLYLIWVFINLIFLIFGGPTNDDILSGDIDAIFYQSSEIVPFTKGNYFVYYDASEFFLYVIIMPALILLVKSLFFEKKK